jgi:hypothetical protein
MRIICGASSIYLGVLLSFAPVVSGERLVAAVFDGPNVQCQLDPLGIDFVGDAFVISPVDGVATPVSS